MEKNRMKANGVAILMMIMFGFVPILKVEAFPCPILCSLKCILVFEPYILCFLGCMIKCELPIADSNCARSCGANKTITVDIGIYSLTKFIFV